MILAEELMVVAERAAEEKRQKCVEEAKTLYEYTLKPLLRKSAEDGNRHYFYRDERLCDMGLTDNLENLLAGDGFIVNSDLRVATLTIDW